MVCVHDSAAWRASSLSNGVSTRGPPEARPSRSARSSPASRRSAKASSDSVGASAAAVRAVSRWLCATRQTQVVNAASPRNPPRWVTILSRVSCVASAAKCLRSNPGTARYTGMAAWNAWISCALVMPGGVAIVTTVETVGPSAGAGVPPAVLSIATGTS